MEPQASMSSRSATGRVTRRRSSRAASSGELITINGSNSSFGSKAIAHANLPRGASSNDAQDIAKMPRERRISAMKTRERSYGSTTSTDFPASSLSQGRRFGAANGSHSAANVKVNALPAPGALSTSIDPPIASTSRETIESPRPVPP